MNNELQQKKNRERYHSYTYALMLFFLIAPMEDLLTGSFGSMAKYVGIIIVFLGIVETRGKIRLRIGAGDPAMIWIMALGVFSCLWARDINTAISRNVTYILLPLICLYVGTLDFSKREYNAILVAAAVGGIITVGYLFIAGKMDLSGTVRLELTERNDPNNFAALLLLPLAIGMDFLFAKKGFVKWLGLITALLTLFAILLTGSRGGLLSVVVFMIMYFIVSKAYKKLGMLLVIIILFLISWYVVVTLLPEFLRWRLFDMESYNSAISSSGQRGVIWKTIITRIIPDMPLWGYGAGNGPIVLAAYYGYLKGVHNTYLNMILEYGLFGIPAFLWMLWSKFKIQIKNKHVLEAALLLGICIAIFFLDSYAKKFFWNILMLLAIKMGVDKSDENPLHN